MSAIFGFVGECDSSDLHAMAGRIAHRGNHVTTWSPAPRVHLGEVRFSPRDPAEDGNLAACTFIGMDWHAVVEGRYDSAEARDAVRRRYMATVLARDPAEAPGSFDGHFAYAWWDTSQNTLTLCTDRVGGQQLFYTRTPRGLCFATDYKALLALEDVAASPDRDAIQFALATSMINLESTLAKDIWRVPQGHTVDVDRHTCRVSPYWRARVRPRRVSRKGAARELREVLIDQVKRSLFPYEKIGLTLSGGLDSPGLLALIRHVYPDKPVSTYTIGYSPDDPEIIGARESAAVFGTNHTELIFDPASIQRDLPRLVWLAEELAGREEALLQYQVERCLMDQEDVVVAGHGADMVFGGMPRHRLIRMAEKIPFAKQGLTDLFQQTQSGAPPASITGKAASLLLYRGRSIAPPSISGASGTSRVFEPSSLDDFIEHTVCEMPEFHFHSGVQGTSPIEPVTPFLSNAVVDHALTIPAALKTTVLRQKIVLRDALSSFLPASIRSRGKAIQRVRHDRELSRVMDALADQLLDGATVRARGLIDVDYVARLRRKGGEDVYSGDRLSRLWMLLVCEIWWRTFIENRGRSPIDLSRE